MIDKSIEANEHNGIQFWTPQTAPCTNGKTITKNACCVRRFISNKNSTEAKRTNAYLNYPQRRLLTANYTENAADYLVHWNS